MAEYIEREALLKKMHGLHTLPFFIGHMTDEDVMFKTMVSIVEEQPTADVVEVVRMPVKGYEGYYEVDQFGRVFGVDRVISVNDNGRQYEKLLKSKQMKQSIHPNGYKTVCLTKDGKCRTMFVHRIVAETFIPNNDNLPMVNHKDEDKTNNFVENLEWCTNEYNLKYGTARKRQAKAIKGKKHTKEHNAKISESLKRYYCSYGERKDSND